MGFFLIVGGGVVNNKILKRQSMKLYLIGALIGLSGAIIFGACSPKEAAESVQPETSAPQQESAENADAPQPASDPESEPIPEPVSEPEPEDALVAYQYDAAGRLVSAAPTPDCSSRCLGYRAEPNTSSGSM